MGDGVGAPAQQEVGYCDEAGNLDRLREQGKSFDRLDLGVKDRYPGRDRERVADDQAGDERAGRQQQERREAIGQRDGERREEDRADGETARGRTTLLEVLRHECRVDPRADRAREDGDVALDDRTGDHWTTTSPFMSMLCRVHSYS